MRLTPCALAISGLDPSGGAGLIADLRAFAAASVWGCGAVAVLTVQSTQGLSSSHPVAARQLVAQVREVMAHQNVRSIKVGALGSADNVRALGRLLRSLSPSVPVVIDPVMSATRRSGGATLLDDRGARAILALAPWATLFTPNVPEAERLLGFRIQTMADAERAARGLVEKGARAALVKGGHLRLPSSPGVATDVLALGARIFHLQSPRVRGDFHGTGCMLSSLVAGKLASQTALTDQSILDAVRWAKQKLKRALLRPSRIGPGLLVLPL